jgi:hypothetical protein
MGMRLGSQNAGANPILLIKILAISSAADRLPLHGEGRKFKSLIAHHRCWGAA